MFNGSNWVEVINSYDLYEDRLLDGSEYQYNNVSNPRKLKYELSECIRVVFLGCNSVCLSMFSTSFKWRNYGAFIWKQICKLNLFTEVIIIIIIKSLSSTHIVIWCVLGEYEAKKGSMSYWIIINIRGKFWTRWNFRLILPLNIFFENTSGSIASCLLILLFENIGGTITFKVQYWRLKFTELCVLVHLQVLHLSLRFQDLISIIIEGLFIAHFEPGCLQT